MACDPGSPRSNKPARDTNKEYRIPRALSPPSLLLLAILTAFGIATSTQLLLPCAPPPCTPDSSIGGRSMKRYRLFPIRNFVL
ncbi:hypothetical protein QR685DRAFT_574485 [Neurospora intermedia]|uniref:Uncharacterized protein n=1 Tax=Neurospora intermedia TaxID=5142 RepID=A0ABR3D7N2_NEUIN